MKKATCFLLVITITFSMIACAFADTASIKTELDSMTVSDRNEIMEYLLLLSSKDKVADINPIEFDQFTRRNPMAIGQTATFSLNDTVCYLTLVSVLRGSKANAKVKDANQFNDMPESGKEYVIATFKLSTILNDSDEKTSLSSWDIDMVDESGAVLSDSSHAGLTDSIEVYSGGSGEFVYAGIVSKNDQPRLIIKDVIWVDISGTTK